MYKKAIFLGVLITVLIIPKITFAAWWNPLTWFNNWTFKELAPIERSVEVEELENRIRELEEKLAIGEATSIPSAISTTGTESVVEPKPKFVSESAPTPKPVVAPAPEPVIPATIPQPVMVPPPQTVVVYPTPQDLSRAANNKSEIINLQNRYINEKEKLLEHATREVERANALLSELSGYAANTMRETVRNLIESERDLLMGYQRVDRGMIQYGEEAKRNIENLNLESFMDEKEVAKFKGIIKSNIEDTTNEFYKREDQKIEFENDLRSLGLL